MQSGLISKFWYFAFQKKGSDSEG